MELNIPIDSNSPPTKTEPQVKLHTPNELNDTEPPSSQRPIGGTTSITWSGNRSLYRTHNAHIRNINGAERMQGAHSITTNELIHS